MLDIMNSALVLSIVGTNKLAIYNFLGFLNGGAAHFTQSLVVGSLW